ncbi:uncharacterized protein LOC108134579 [Drosophila elegans]|uniref:uncharacterized protein LOC108134579 n=1 Tax=Drosophila elegans TaxID=30023 RepID=UPI0007E641ED|nr:uncharacterized protein LOC108134579 [Drosophila elegans]
MKQSTDENPMYECESSFIADESLEGDAFLSQGLENESLDGSSVFSQAACSSSSKRRRPNKPEMTPFEAAMVEATNRCTDELVNMSQNLIELGDRRLQVMERIEKTLETIEKRNADQNT